MQKCDYGCGKEAKYQFDNGKFCCSDHYMKCSSKRKRITGKNNPFYGKTHTEESKIKSSEKNKGKTAWNKGISRTDSEKKLISKNTKKAMSKPEVRELLNHRPPLKQEDHPLWSGGY